MQRSDLRRMVADRLGITETGDAFITPAVINGHINEALVDYCRERQNWPWLLTSSTLTLTSGSAALPTRFMRARELLIGTPALRALNVDLADLDSGLDAGCRWTVRGQTIAVSPTPTAALTGTFWFYQAEPQLSLETDTPLMPEHFQPILVNYAVHVGALMRRDDARADQFLKLYTRGLTQMDSAINQQTRPRRVRVRDDDEWLMRAAWS